MTLTNSRNVMINEQNEQVLGEITKSGIKKKFPLFYISIGIQKLKEELLYLTCVEVKLEERYMFS